MSLVFDDNINSLQSLLKNTSYYTHLEKEYSKSYFKRLNDLVEDVYIKSNLEEYIYPQFKNIFRALELTPFDNVKVVIIGQDPYINPDQAQGLSFSVPTNTKLPPSLKNIFIELKNDLGIDRKNGNLDDWAHQGVLLLNSTLTVEKGKSNSHKDFGWMTFTDEIVKLLSEKKQGIVWILWGGFAQKKEKLIDKSKHHIINGAHPSPLSCTKFFGGKYFSKCNEYLESKINF